MFYIGETYAEVFTKLREDLLQAPIVNSRNGRTKEILPATIEITDPKSCIIFHPNRKYNLAFNIAEFVTYVLGINSVEFLQFFNCKISDYSDNGIDFYGAYGPRISSFIPSVIQKLKGDQETRQAVINIYESKDMLAYTRDVPCTLSLHFIVRNNRLNLHTMMRSNDLIWGLQYDIVNWCLLQTVIAQELGLELGSYIHTTTSLHVYEYHWDLLNKMEYVLGITVGDVPKLNSIPAIFALMNEIVSMPKERVASIGTNLLDIYDFVNIVYKHKLKKEKIDMEISTPEWAKGLI